jgi:hypothetical protein
MLNSYKLIYIVKDTMKIEVHSVNFKNFIADEINLIKKRKGCDVAKEYNLNPRLIYKWANRKRKRGVLYKGAGQPSKLSPENKENINNGPN